MDRIEQIARICHEVNRVYCATIGDDSQKPWDGAEDWQRESAIDGVRYAINNPEATPRDQHEAWMLAKAAAGWKYGTVKDAATKEHPCMVSYLDLPLEQRLKDYLFRAIVDAFSTASAGEPVASAA